MLEKHAFIRYLVAQHTYKQKKAIWVLNFLAHNEIYLDDVRFVEDITDCPRSLILSTHEMNTPVLLYRDKNGETIVPEEIIRRIQNSIGSPLYVQANFPNWQGNKRYLRVLEENPFIDTLPYQDELTRCTEEIIENVQKELLKQQLAKEIDFALDSKNEMLFDALTKKLAEL